MNPIANQEEWMMQITPNMSEEEKQIVLNDQYWIGMYFTFIKRLTKFGFISFQIFAFYETFRLIMFELQPNFIITLIYTLYFIGCIRALYYGSMIDNRQMKNISIPESDEEGLDKQSVKNYCEKCQIQKDPKTHHCKVCCVCNEEMDHHCFFLGNCVGKNNYRFFISYIFYVFQLSLMTIYLLNKEFQKLIAFEWKILNVSFFRLLFVYSCGCGFLLLASILIITHIYILMNDTTQINLKFIDKELPFPLSRVFKTLFCFRCSEFMIMIKGIDASWKRRSSNGWFGLFYP